MQTQLRSAALILLVAASYPSIGEDLVTCKEIGAVSTGIGWPAHGDFSNDDYGFSIHVPSHVTAWSGAAKEAPFHGFGFKIDKMGQSCIDLYLEWRVDRDEPPSLPIGLVNIPIRGATAGVANARGEMNGKPYLNRVVYFTSKQKIEFVDGRISLIVPVGDEKRARAIFDAFVRSLRFFQD